MTVLSQHSPPVVNSGSGSEGVDTPEDNPTLEMQRYYYRPPFIALLILEATFTLRFLGLSCTMYS